MQPDNPHPDSPPLNPLFQGDTPSNLQPALPPEDDHGKEAAVAFARAKLEALLAAKSPGWQPPAESSTLPMQAVQPPYSPSSQPPAPPPSYELAPVATPHPPPAPQYGVVTPPASIYPMPTQPVAPFRPVGPATGISPLPETIPQAQYELEVALQNEIPPQYHHVSPDHQLPPEPQVPALPLPTPDTTQYQTMQLPEQIPAMQTPTPGQNIIPPPSIHQQQAPLQSRTGMIKAHTDSARAAVQRVHHGFLKPIFRTAIVTLIIFLIYNAPLVMGQVHYYITPASNDPTPVILDPSTATGVSAEPRVIISKLNIDVPAVYDEESYDERKIQEALERGIVHYGTTALPGEKGNAVFLGHSSNSPWAPGRYKTAFSLLRKLQVNDTFVLHYEKKRYIYQVYERKVIDPSDFSVISQDVREPIATLITCDPPGANWKRLVIHARQISPNPADNKPHRGATTVPDSRSIPGSPPSLWERVTSIF